MSGKKTSTSLQGSDADLIKMNFTVEVFVLIWAQSLAFNTWQGCLKGDIELGYRSHTVVVSQHAC